MLKKARCSLGRFMDDHAVVNLSIALFIFYLKLVTNIYGLLEDVKQCQVFHFSKVYSNFVIVTGFLECNA
uniref:Uncharacterized protein n=1 Tax=Glossina palpalis gambiensis TaxID=67801 RepID=A0A1B0BYY1_9MUSC